ncbi:uncharacterized protein TRUGW13939_00891 [Talaromyces rugulosus]|uniref:Uncharacterized protein n=1 Tax=Talaromyces rugulosus TaxID=121627 RepID=A0A7H8QJT5_TALRU|nr:uncharacterized protein TRUGW13939_00891 [Talaromyces rugulosus]QKX53811.1 hypothetical protein TRUGW13939_00891 [Talaromyces rugulosus]
MQLAVNHLSHFLLTNLLMPKILAAEHPRVVNLSSYGHRMSAFRFDDPLWSGGATYDRLYAYAQRKLPTYSFHVATKLARHIDSEGWKTRLKYFSKHSITRPERKFPEQGAGAPLRALLDPSLVTEAGVYLTDTELTTNAEVIKPYATVPEDAERLWRFSEEVVGQSFTY